MNRKQLSNKLFEHYKILVPTPYFSSDRAKGRWIVTDARSTSAPNDRKYFKTLKAVEEYIYSTLEK